MTYLGMPVSPARCRQLRGSQPFPDAAETALADAQLRRNLGNATSTIRAKRAGVVAEVPDWQQLRAAGAAIKDDVLAHLDDYLLQLEARVTERGGVVHWARDAARRTGSSPSWSGATGSTEVVKVKSMATQEIGLNEALAEAGITAYETDLAELIVQLGDDRPSHILVPAIHRNRTEIRDIFLAEMAGVRPGADRRPGGAGRGRPAATCGRSSSPPRSRSAAPTSRVAETGTLAVVESEGNGRMCLTLPETLITVMGIEKLLPTSPTWRCSCSCCRARPPASG